VHRGGTYTTLRSIFFRLGADFLGKKHWHVLFIQNDGASFYLEGV